MHTYCTQIPLLCYSIVAGWRARVVTALRCAADLRNTHFGRARFFAAGEKKCFASFFAHYFLGGGSFDGILKHKKLFVLELCDV